MFKPRVAALAVVASVALGIGAAGEEGGKAGRRRVYRAEFPDSAAAGKWVAERACLMCHSATLVTQQAKDSAAWDRSLAQMERWGVRLNPEERDSLHHYLVTHFGPVAIKR